VGSDSSSNSHLSNLPNYHAPYNFQRENHSGGYTKMGLLARIMNIKKKAANRKVKQAKPKPAVRKVAKPKPAVRKVEKPKPAVRKVAKPKPAVRKVAKPKPAAKRVVRHA
jgi:outer membrane biosynthesis protein TonB